MNEKIGAFFDQFTDHWTEEELWKRSEEILPLRSAIV